MRSTSAAISSDIAAIGREGIDRLRLSARPVKAGPSRFFPIAAGWTIATALGSAAQAQQAPCHVLGVWTLTHLASVNMNTNEWLLPLGNQEGSSCDNSRVLY